MSKLKEQLKNIKEVRKKSIRPEVFDRLDKHKDWPIFYDLNTDEFRPATQKDLEILQEHVNRYIMLRTYLRDHDEERKKYLEESKNCG